MTAHPRKLFVLFAAIMAAHCQMAMSQDSPPTKRTEQKDLSDLWSRHRRNFVCVDGKFIRLPAELDELLKQDPGWQTDKLILEPLVGGYGRPNGFTVVQVLDETNMLVSEINTFPDGVCAGVPIVYSPAIVRLAGFSTRNYADQKRYDKREPQVAIVSRWTYKTAAGPSKVAFLAVPLDQVLSGLTFEQFKNLVATGVALGPDRKAEAEARERQHSTEEEARQAKRSQKKVQSPKDLEVPAASKLKLAKSLRDNGKVESAKRFLKELVAEYPSTKAAKEARSLLDEMGD